MKTQAYWRADAHVVGEDSCSFAVLTGAGYGGGGGDGGGDSTAAP